MEGGVRRNIALKLKDSAPQKSPSESGRKKEGEGDAISEREWVQLFRASNSTFHVDHRVAIVYPPAAKVDRQPLRTSSTLKFESVHLTYNFIGCVLISLSLPPSLPPSEGSCR